MTYRLVVRIQRGAIRARERLGAQDHRTHSPHRTMGGYTLEGAADAAVVHAALVEEETNAFVMITVNSLVVMGIAILLAALAEALAQGQRLPNDVEGMV
jgi:hypothetical protein